LDGSRDLDKLYSTHVNRGKHASHIANYAAAECDDHGFAIRAQLQQVFCESLYAGKPLKPLAIAHLDNLGSETGTCERFQEHLAPASADLRDGDHKYGWCSAEQVVQNLTRA